MENLESATTPIADYLLPAEIKDSKIVENYHQHQDNTIRLIISTRTRSIFYRREEGKEQGCLIGKESLLINIGDMMVILLLDLILNLVILEYMETICITRILKLRSEMIINNMLT